MLDNDQIAAASRTLHDHWRAGTKLAKPRNAAAAARPRRGLRDPGGESKAIRPENCSAGRSPPPARPGRSTSMSMARWPGASCPRRSLPMAAPPRWREMKCASPSPNSPFAWRADLPPRPSPYTVQRGSRCGRHASSGDRDSGFAVCGFCQRRRGANHRGQCLRASCSCSAHHATSNWRALDLVEERPVITLRGKQYIGHGKNVLGDPRIALAWLANELRQLGVTLQAGEVVTTGTCHPPLPIQSGDLFAADFGSIGKVSVRSLRYASRA